MALEFSIVLRRLIGYEFSSGYAFVRCFESYYNKEIVLPRIAMNWNGKYLLAVLIGVLCLT